MMVSHIGPQMAIFILYLIEVTMWETIRFGDSNMSKNGRRQHQHILPNIPFGAY